MQTEFNVRKKLGAFIAQIDHLLLSDFPHADTRSALELVRSHFDAFFARLDNAAQLGNATISSQLFITINERIYENLPILGFLLRSTNVRNSFESYDAFVEIAKSLIGSDAKVVMSSEWDLSPLTYPMNIPVLPNFVLLGMPTPEAGNALILPLAGHELGHILWTTQNMDRTLSAKLANDAKEFLTGNAVDFKRAFTEHAGTTLNDKEIEENIFLNEVISEIANVSASKIEETFCDAIGVSLFGESFVHAFHYLLAPSLGGGRSIYYPPLRSRANFIKSHGDLDLPSIGFPDYPRDFADGSINFAPREEFVSRAADHITNIHAAAMYQAAKDLVTRLAPTHAPSAEGRDDIYNMYRKGVPARRPRSLSDILNAGWKYVREGEHDEAERPLFDWISELMLKSIEVLEYRRRLASA